jgi:hypothetical protein
MDPANQNGAGAGAGDGNGAGDQNINNNGNQNPNGNGANGQGTTPPANGNGSGNGAGQGDAQGVQLTDEQLAAAFNHPRFKALNERAKKAEELEKQQQEAERKAAEEQGKFQDLYKSAEERATKAEAALKQTRIENAATLAAAKLGVIDPAAAIKLMDQSGISVSDDGTISGVAEAVKALQTSSPYLFKTPAQGSVGGGDTNPAGGGNTASEFTYSQIQDLAFYKANQAAVDKAVAEGRIDMSK